MTWECAKIQHVNWISHFCVIVIQYHDQSYLKNRQFIWDYGSRGIRVHHSKNSYEQIVGMVHLWQQEQESKGSHLQKQA